MRTLEESGGMNGASERSQAGPKDSSPAEEEIPVINLDDEPEQPSEDIPF